MEKPMLKIEKKIILRIDLENKQWKE